jgi:transposase
LFCPRNTILHQFLSTIVRRDSGESHEQFLTGVAKASGMETPTREDLARLDRKREKRTSNKSGKAGSTWMRALRR